MAPNTAAPTACPTMRAKSTDDVATARSLQLTAACTETMRLVLRKPMPEPITADATLAHTSPCRGLSATRATEPRTSCAAPSTEAWRYEERIMRRAATTLPAVHVNDSMASTTP